MKTFTKKALSIFISIALLLSYLPLTALNAAAAENSTSIADPKTLSDWNMWFTPESSRYAGGVFLDKSVYTASEAVSDPYFNDIKDKLALGKDNFGNENFLIALSALGSNSEILGYSYTPTDTMIVLDASTSMGTEAAAYTAIDDMIDGANDAMVRLLSLNNYNRVGVVVYNGSSSVLLPLDRYSSTAAAPSYLQYSRRGGTNYINVAANVLDGDGNAVPQNSIAQYNGTYTQGGFYAATQEFLKADTVIDEDKIQGGTNRIPIMVFMSDGQPSYRINTDANRQLTGNNYPLVDLYDEATNANCDGDWNFQEDDITAFSTMLTAAWAEGEISAHYNQDARFYTLGYNLDADHAYAHNVLDPMNPNNPLAARFSSFATQYLAMAKGETELFSQWGADSFNVTRQSDPARVTNLDYVDKYWQATGEDQLTDAFDSIVDEIVIQSRYYSTLVESKDHNNDGFISFTDEIGTHMEVKDLKGFYIGENKLVTGGMFAEFATTGSVSHVGENYTDEALANFENEILTAVSTRFSISRTDAHQLVDVAIDNGFISYDAASGEFSNYVAWYANENNEFLAPYTGNASTLDSTAKYIVRSYFYMGDVTQNHVETSMLYALVRVREDIQTGRQIVDINIPASLLPMVTYTITVDGDEFTGDNLTGMTCTQKNPISLLFEVGTDSELTPYNISEKIDNENRKNQNGDFVFYTNRWRNDAADAAFVIPENPNPHIFDHGVSNTTLTQFIPSLQNERQYFTSNTKILNSSYNEYPGSKPTATDGNKYFTKFEWVELQNGSPVLNYNYNPISENILKDAENIIQIDGKTGWYVAKGTARYYFGEEVHGEQAHTHKTQNLTGTLGWSDYPQIVHHESEAHNGYHMLNYLGNNGTLTATPAQGIMLTKAVTSTVSGAENSFTFSIALSGSGLEASYPVHFIRADGTTEDITQSVVQNQLKVSLGAGDTAYVTGIAAGTQYTVTEDYNKHYVVQSVTNASGTIADRTLSKVSFVNEPKGYGSLLVAKDVTHSLPSVSEGLESQRFSILVTFDGTADDLAQIVAPQGAVTTDNKTYSLNLSDGTDALFTNLPAGIGYTVTENNLPKGYTLITPSAELQGVIANNTRSDALLVNRYDPVDVSPAITVSGDKIIRGRAWDSAVDSGKYQVALQPVIIGTDGIETVGTPKTTYIEYSATTADYSIDMSSIVYDTPGAYSYVVYEVKSDNPVANIAYDNTIAFFTVTVTDSGLGQLEISSVEAQQGLGTVTDNGNGQWTVNKDFTNTYTAATVSIPVKKVVEQNGTPINEHLGGIHVGLFESNTATAPKYTTITDQNGNGTISWNLLKDDYATTKYFYLREIAPLNANLVPGMTYDTSVRYVVGVNWAVGDAPTVTYYEYDPSAANQVGAPISGVSANAPLSVVNTYEPPLSNPLSFGGTKTLNGGALRDGDSFEMVLCETDAAFSEASIKALDSAVVNAQSANGAYSFKPLQFDKVGTYYLMVYEKAENKDNGIVYDGTRYHITVTVTKQLQGNTVVLVTTATHVHKVGAAIDVAANDLDFNNQYFVNDEVSIPVSGQKNLNGRRLVEGEFTFGLFVKGSATPLQTVTNKADGSFAFDDLTFTMVNSSLERQVLEYEIRELIPTDTAGVTYDTTVYPVTVTLTDDGNGGIDADVSGNTGIVFNNTYSAAGTSLTLSGTKTLLGKADGSFIFDLFETDENFAIIDKNSPAAHAEVTLTDFTADYAITLNYTAKDRGYHYYVLSERVPENTRGIHYDSTRYDIVVNVLDNGHGEMEAQIIEIFCPFHNSLPTASTLNFVNRYEAAPTEHIVQGRKELIGRELKDGEFEFSLFEVNTQTNELTLIETTKNKADGSFAFDTVLSFNKVGSYSYLVAEKDLEDENVDYDTTLFRILVTVADDGQGKLSAQSMTEAYNDGTTTQVNEIVFNNVYNEPPAEEEPPVEEPPAEEPPAEEPPEVPSSPKTGDFTDLAPWLAVLFVSGTISATAVFAKRKKEA